MGQKLEVRIFFKWGLQLNQAQARAGRAMTECLSINPPLVPCSGGDLEEECSEALSRGQPPLREGSEIFSQREAGMSALLSSH